MVNEGNKVETLKQFGYFGLLPIFIVILTGILWLIGGVIWVILFIINSITIWIFRVVFLIIDWPFIAVDWLLGGIGRFIVGYFTMDHWFNLEFNFYFLMSSLVLGILYVIITRPTKKPDTRIKRKPYSSTNPTKKASDQIQFLRRMGVNTSNEDTLNNSNLQMYANNEIAENLRNAMLRYDKLLYWSKGSRHPELDNMMKNYEKKFGIVNKTTQQVSSSNDQTTVSSDNSENIIDDETKKYIVLMSEEVQKMNDYLDEKRIFL